MSTYPFIIIISGFLVALWVYSALSKLSYWTAYKHAMKAQVFPNWICKILTYVIPALELALALLLIFNKTRLLAMYSSFFLMFLFTLYIGGAVYQVYSRYPCACGGLFSRLGWKKHFKLNIGLTLIALAGVLLMEL
ncbi:MauE/DoxX family redox-associated membrane protein [Pedobacter sp. AW31-3R]|uniref:MauE/DoxX family redox-associated membrane protein n=1 Tax=Pedobacter sp. AW31-3R TaxID=3445781 RepID=UPI003F9F4352